MLCGMSGDVTNADLKAFAEDVVALERTQPAAPPRIVDFSGVTKLSFDFSMVRELANRRRQREFPNGYKSAIVAPDLAQFGFARMWQIINDHPRITIAIFGDRESAIAWASDPSSPRPEPGWSPQP
jgi:hypothetical protein